MSIKYKCKHGKKISVRTKNEQEQKNGHKIS